jgi:hypothetical protein
MRALPLVAARSTSRAGSLHGAVLIGDAFGVGALPFFPTLILRDGISGRYGGAQRHAALLHQLEYFGCAAIAVFDGFDAGQGGAAHAFGGAGVGYYPPAS